MRETAAMATYGLLNDLGARIAEAGRSLTAFAGGRAPALPELCETLLSGRGEAVGLALAVEALARYARLDLPEKAAFFEDAALRFGPDAAALTAAVERWREEGHGAARALHRASEPRSRELIRRLNRAPGGTRALLRMREDLLALLSERPGLRPLDHDFHDAFATWFNRGFLELRSIDWDTPAAILEKIIAYEAVHEIQGWGDLRRRVAAPDRRLYAFFHPALCDDPLIFVEVALPSEIPAAIGPILAPNREALDPARAGVAVFYSISNCQKGLRGVSFGNFLIKQVAEELKREFPGLRSFVTLSPVPGLAAWARAEAAREDGALGPKQAAAVETLDAPAPEPEAAEAARAALAEIAALYLVEGRDRRGVALDPVARFHLGNGARLERINPEGDDGARARRLSWGLMVNYLYDLGEIERNHEAYAQGGEVIASAAARRLARRR
jgi:malonyl-CoA decarboxylase